MFDGLVLLCLGEWLVLCIDEMLSIDCFVEEVFELGIDFVVVVGLLVIFILKLYCYYFVWFWLEIVWIVIWVGDLCKVEGNDGWLYLWCSFVSWVEYLCGCLVFWS